MSCLLRNLYDFCINLNSWTRTHYVSRLFNIVFLVAVPCYSICRKMNFVASGPLRGYSSSLCCHCTNRLHCTHIHLKIVCPVFFVSQWTPRAIPPVLIQPTIVWIIITIVVCACRYSGIWYFVSVLYTNSTTCWTTKKRKKTQLNKALKTKLSKTNVSQLLSLLSLISYLF